MLQWSVWITQPHCPLDDLLFIFKKCRIYLIIDVDFHSTFKLIPKRTNISVDQAHSLICKEYNFVLKFVKVHSSVCQKDFHLEWSVECFLVFPLHLYGKETSYYPHWRECQRTVEQAKVICLNYILKRDHNFTPSFYFTFTFFFRIFEKLTTKEGSLFITVLASLKG